MADEQSVNPNTQVGKWLAKIRKARKVEAKWRKSAEKITKRYREEDIERNHDGVKTGASRFNILYANVSVLSPSIFQNAPRPDVRRRYDPRPQGIDENPQIKQGADQLRKAASDASDIIERALSVQLDKGDFETEALDAVKDMLLPGRGVMRYRYEAETVDEPAIEQAPDPLTGELTEQPVIGEDGKPVLNSRIVDQRVWGEYVYWKDFVTAPGRRWSMHDSPMWIAFRHLPDKEELKEFFPKMDVSKVPMKWIAEDEAIEKDRLGEADRAELWEIWDRTKRKIIWVANGHKEILETADAPFDLEDFYPVAPPMYGVRTNDTLVPVAELEVYADLAAELDQIQERISVLTEMVKVAGAYSGDQDAVAQVIAAKDGVMIPIKSFSTADGKGLEDSIWFWPIQNIVQVIAQLYIQREQVKQTIYEVVGISDILRGSSNPNETLGAQRIKTQFGTLRIDERRRQTNRSLRDGLRIMGEIIAEKFEPDILERMTGIGVSDGARSILRDEGMRGFIVDIESDSTVAPDETAEQESVTKLLTAVSTFLQGMAPLVQAGMMTPQQVMDILKFAIRPFRGARLLEETLDQAERALEQQASQPPEPEEDPDAKTREAELAIKGKELEIKTVEAETAKITSENEIITSEIDVEKEEVKLEQLKAKPKESKDG